ncbi:MAG: hypothetical protein ACP5F3_02060 [Candidatus Syntrophosphaera sp.]
MDQEILKALAKDLATRVNCAVDIPLVKEEDEQALFELIILIVIELIFTKLGFMFSIEE